jgi:mono/diheme cytochrome c family protein
MNFSKSTSLLFTLMILTGVRLFAQVWEVPEDQKKKVSPYRFNADSIKKGETIYTKNCQSCHGNPGKNNWAKISPAPGDPASDKYQSQTDGEMFFRITTGKIPMPEFRNILSENERWNVISYIRSFNPKYIQPNPEIRTGPSGKQVILKMQYLKEKEKIQVNALEITPEKKELASKGVEIALFVKRYFGNMQLGDPKITNDKGEIMFDIPATLPSDRQGNLELTAMIHDASGKTGEAQAKATIAAGKPNIAPSLIATRAWWSVRENAPIWVILTYTLSVLIVWGFILYIIYSVLRIRKIS